MDAVGWWKIRPPVLERALRSPDPSRRRLLSRVATLPLAGVAAVAATRLGANAALLRPAGRGNSDVTCAQCGGAGHSMLMSACPAAPGVL